MIHEGLPRQARDQRKENSTKGPAFYTGITRSSKAFLWSLCSDLPLLRALLLLLLPLAMMQPVTIQRRRQRRRQRQRGRTLRSRSIRDAAVRTARTILAARAIPSTLATNARRRTPRSSMRWGTLFAPGGDKRNETKRNETKRSDVSVCLNQFCLETNAMICQDRLGMR